MNIKVCANNKYVNLKGEYFSDTGKIIIYKDSKYRVDYAPSCMQHILRARDEILPIIGDNGTIVKDYEFNTAGGAASILCGSMTNGLDFFREVETNKTLNEFLGNKETKSLRISPKEKPYLLLEGEKKFTRIYSVGKKALTNSGFTCYVDANHETFITDAGSVYMEAHHLIPFKYQKDFVYSLQVPANIVCLCPECHRKLHYGKDRKILLKRLYDDRKFDLKKAKIGITFAQLCKYYDIE